MLKMKNTHKIILLVITLVVLVVILSFSTSGLISGDSSSEYTNSWTKAICNETHCQDYVIYCEGDEFVRQSPISGAVISISPEWEDPRDEEMRERVCGFD